MKQGDWFQKLSRDQAEEAVRLYLRGLSIGPIAAFFGVSRQSMWDLLRRRITLRPQRRFGPENHFYRGGARKDDHSQNMVEYAIRVGILIPRDACEKCGEAKLLADGRRGIQAHHDDYNKPLDVRWLCQACHHEWHKTHEAIPKTPGSPVPHVESGRKRGGYHARRKVA